MFDPWTATLEDAIKEMALDPENPNYLPVKQVGGVSYILGLQERVEGGDGFAVLACINECVSCQLVAPYWLALAFHLRYIEVERLRAKSWDDPKAFGKPFPKGTQINALRKRHEIGLAVFNSIEKILSSDPERPIDEWLFEEVGEEFSIGKTLVSEYYYEWKEILEREKILRNKWGKF